MGIFQNIFEVLFCEKYQYLSRNSYKKLVNVLAILTHGYYSNPIVSTVIKRTKVMALSPIKRYLRENTPLPTGIYKVAMLNNPSNAQAKS